MKKRFLSAILAAVLTVGVSLVALTACDKKEPYFEKETVFYLDRTLSTPLGALGKVCEPGTMTFRPDGTATLDVPFTETAYGLMDTMLGFRIPDFKHDDTYSLNSTRNEIIYHSTREGFVDPMMLELETLSDGSYKFLFDISAQIPNTILTFYSNEDKVPVYKPEEEEPEPEVKEKINVTFKVGEGVAFEEGFTLPEAAVYEEPTEITMPDAKFSKEENTFRGWAANGMIYEHGANYLFQPGEKVKVDRNTEFIAVWSDSFHVRLTKGEFGKGSVGDMVMPDTLYGEYVYLPENPYDYIDYSKGFAGWTDGKGKTVQPGGGYKVTEDVVFEPVWAEFVTVTFKANADDTTSFIIRTPKGTNITLPDAACVGANNTAFAGWKKNGTGTYASKPGASVTIKEDTVYIAHTAAQVTIHFDANGGTGTAPADIVAGNNLYFVMPACNLTREGYVFNGWATTATKTYGTMPGGRANVSKNTTYYAVWNAIRTVSFATGVEGQTIPSVQQGETMKIVLPDVEFENGNKLFDGWTDGSKIYKAGDSYTVPKDGDTELTAVWRNPVTVSFTGGEGATGSMEDIVVYETKSFTFPANNFVMAGKIFAGWTDGTDSYRPGDTYTVPAQSEELTFSAIWNEGTPYADYEAVFRTLMNTVEVYKDSTGKSVTLNNFFPKGSMTELVLRPDLTADFRVISALSEKDFNTHNTAGSLGLTLAKFQENFAIDKKNISYDYDKEKGIVKLNLGDGQTMEIKLTKTAKDDTIGFDNVQFEFELTNKLGAVEKLTFAAIDGKPSFLAEKKVFKGKVPEDVPSFGGTAVTLTVNNDGTGRLQASFLGLNFTHQFTPDMKKILWLGDEGAFLEGEVGEADGKMTIAVTLLGVSITLTEA